ncbi:MAG: InlB B-repeat-containing protein [Muribaculum sp.]|nr:InlB B-repeat-containing protein [Muribaculum sp.]
MRRMRHYGVWLGILFGVLCRGIPVCAETIYDSPYVTFSPDGQAWTTNAGDRNVKWYKDDGSDDVVTGVEESLAKAQTGEHYYTVKRTGTIPVAEWQVKLSSVNCCHTSYPPEEVYHGVKFVKSPCMQKHFSAWRPICADCGQPIVYGNFYMSREAAGSIRYLEVGHGLCYYYLCPFNRNLEQGMDTKEHVCRAVSANRYRIVYQANAQEYAGYMAPSFHLYGNSERYEGREVTPLKHLSYNAYTRVGWEFVGWNTEADGSGTDYADGAEILNLCAEDYGENPEAATVVLYAKWRPSRGVLEIDPAGGSYDGTEGITRLNGDYGQHCQVRTDLLEAPAGALVCFDVQGGAALDAVRGTQRFVEWRQSDPFGGRLRGEDYTFGGGDGNVDRITAVYERNPIRLPRPVKENLSFGGWYYDKEFQLPAGDAGAELVPARDLTLYAQWVELRLDAGDNYEANGGTGAVDLSWSQNDGREKQYKLYQSRDGKTWKQIYAADDLQSSLEWKEQAGLTNKASSLQAPYAGLYRITAYGAQGGDYGLYQGGLGGKVTGSFWLDRGETVEFSVAGQNGFNGGGIGTAYACGGGYSVAGTEADGILLLAGGGGGAGDCGDGLAGGSSQSLVEQGREGEKGASGGGGGYLGGRAGEMKVHRHVEGVCNHVHQGDSSKSGGCYTTVIKCTEKLEHIYTGSETWYWGGSDEEYCPNCGADASLGQSCTGHETDYYTHKCPIHGTRKNNTQAKKPTTCGAVAGYGLSCGRTEEYFCGYPYDGYVISAKPSYGGSSYVNTAAAYSYEQTAGVRAGDGGIEFEAEDVGYLGENDLDGVWAKDLAAPDQIAVGSVDKSPLAGERIVIRWREPEDHGTVYYHRAESYAAGDTERISLSNMTVNTLTSGVKGYWYCVDADPETKLAAGEGYFLERAELEIALSEGTQYLHVLAVDRAGNGGEAIHIPIGGRIGGSPDVKWPLITEPLAINIGENVYPANENKTYYVRADGRTPITLSFGCRLQGPASEQYQPNYAILESADRAGDPVRNSVYAPSGEVKDGEWDLQTNLLRFASEGESCLSNGNYVAASRSLRCRRLSLIRELLPERSAHGHKIPVIPIGGAVCGEEVVYSEYTADQENGLWLVGDGEAPQIHGLEMLEDRALLDRREETICLRVTAQDDLSGVKELYLEIENTDNGCVMRYDPDEQGVITVEICRDEPIFSGDFKVTAYAADHVGNENRVDYHITEFDLCAAVTRTLEPHTPQFKRGEEGCLHITSWGYADRVEVEFPEEFVMRNPELCHVYTYEADPMYKREEQLTFTIPLDVEECEEYTITVRAYKGGKMLEVHPALAVLGVQGTVLDELRTRLR